MSPAVTDTIRMVFTFVIATIVIVGGGLMLYATRLDPAESNSQNLALLLSGFIGAAITFVFGRETATQATRAAQSSTKAGSDSQTGNGHSV